jgi:hypothetical protein
MFCILNSHAEFVKVEVELLVINVMGRAAWEEGDIKRRTLLISTGL